MEEILKEAWERLEQGEGLRPVARSAGMSHEKLRTLIKEQQGGAEMLERRKSRVLERTKERTREWARRGKELRERKDLEERLFCAVASRFSAKATEAGPAYERAARYRLAHKRKSYSPAFSQLVDLFSAYEQAQARGEKHSFAQLAEAAGVAPSTARDILRRAGLESMHGLQPEVTNKERERVHRALALGLTDEDAAYLSDVGVASARNQRKRLKAEAREKKFPYRLVSEILLMRDAGYGKGEILEELGIDEYSLWVIEKNASGYRVAITRMLQEIHADGTIDTPYLDPAHKIRR